MQLSCFLRNQNCSLQQKNYRCKHEQACYLLPLKSCEKPVSFLEQMILLHVHGLTAWMNKVKNIMWNVFPHTDWKHFISRALAWLLSFELPSLWSTKANGHSWSNAARTKYMQAESRVTAAEMPLLNECLLYLSLLFLPSKRHSCLFIVFFFPH